MQLSQPTASNILDFQFLKRELGHPDGFGNTAEKRPGKKK
jgi:hypothetical protein